MKVKHNVLPLIIALVMVINCSTLATAETYGETIAGIEESSEKSTVLPGKISVPDNDFRTDLQYSYLMDKNVENVYAYANGIEQLSIPKGILCGFSGDNVGDASTYVFQRASSADFTDALNIEGLTEKRYTFHNLLLGEHFFWRGGASMDTIGESPVHEITVTDIPPPHLLCGRRNKYS